MLTGAEVLAAPRLSTPSQNVRNSTRVIEPPAFCCRGNGGQRSIESRAFVGW